ncbi:MAG: transglycosylase SLT domain-containing protein, partial [Gemmatimonadetes bacterium]|nr:transglycosylase SLT domain-containing protein [Gemmatimonadota bacterium]
MTANLTRTISLLLITGALGVGSVGCAVRPAPPIPPPVPAPIEFIEEDTPSARTTELLSEAEDLYEYALDHYRSGLWERAGEIFEETVHLIDRNTLATEGTVRGMRAASLLRAKSIYYRDRCSVQAAENDVPPEPVAAQEVVSTFPIDDHIRVDHWKAYFEGRGREGMARWLRRTGKYRDLFEQTLLDYNLPRELFYVSMIESGLNPNAYSRAHAVGAWQFISSTGRLYGLKSDWWFDDRRDPERSCRAAAEHLKDLYEVFGDWYLVLAAYNCGQARVKREMRRSNSSDFWDLDRLPRQTRDYVPKFLAAHAIGENPEAHGFYVTPEPPLVYETIEVEGTVSLEAVAHCAGASLDEIETLNPAVRRRVTPPTRDRFYLHLPEGTSDRVAGCLDGLPKEQRVTWQEYRVRVGDTISEIADKFGTSITAIADINKLRSRHRIRVGQKLLIPKRVAMSVPPFAIAAAEPSPADRSVIESQERKSAAAAAGTRRVTHRVRSGDTLSEIAAQYNVNVSSIKEW